MSEVREGELIDNVNVALGRAGGREGWMRDGGHGRDCVWGGKDGETLYKACVKCHTNSTTVDMNSEMNLTCCLLFVDKSKMHNRFSKHRLPFLYFALSFKPAFL